MIAAQELAAIINAYGTAPEIIIEGDRMEKHIDSPLYTLHRPDGDYTVTGLGWGHGHLFVGTRERGTTGIIYEHEDLGETCADEEDLPQCGPIQTTLEAWL